MRKFADVNEISCRVTAVAFDHLPKVGLSVERWCEGLDVTPEHLANPKATIPWSTLMDLMARLEQLLGGPEEMIAYIKDDLSYAKTGVILRVYAMAGSTVQLYRIHAWLSRTFASGVDTSVEVLGPDRLRIHVSFLDEDMALPEVLWTFMIAFFSGLPRLIGLSDARVVATGEGRSRVYDVVLPASTGLWSRLRASWYVIRHGQAPLGMLVAQQEEISRRYEQLVAEMARREQAEARLRHGQKLEALGQLASGIAHDFNNLLTIIGGNLELLGDELEGRPDLEALIEDAQQAAKAGGGLISNLLAFSRGAASKTELVDIREVVRPVVRMLQRTLPSTASIELETPAQECWCELDTARLQNALLNLVVNANQATQGGGVVRITIDDVPASAHSAGVLALTVADNGPGMTAEVLDRALEPFFSTKESGLGTGLGLAMVSSFAHDSAGELRINSAPGEGCRVTLSLPRAARRDEPEQPRR